jgi:hypothetical protein
MALLDSYADAEAYKDALKGTSSADDTVIDNRLDAVARLIDAELVLPAGTFNADAAAQRFFDGNGEAIMDLDAFATLTTVDVDTGLGGTFSQSVTVSNIELRPYNVAARSEPYTSVRLKPFAANTELAKWTKGPRTVRITADWGWPAVPELVRDLNIALAHDLWDLIRAGSTLTLAQIDIGVRLTPNTNNLLKRAMRVYGPKLAIV